MIIDSHLHLSLDDNNDTYEKSFDRLLENLKKNSIDQAIIIPDHLANSGCANLEVLERVAKKPGIFFMVSPYIFKYSKDDVDRIKELLAAKKVLAIKFFPGHDAFYPTDKRCEPFYELCLKHDVPIVFHTGINTNNHDCAKYNNPRHIAKIAQKYPDLKIVIAHYFWPEMEHCYQTTKDYPNIYFDTSAVADDEVVAESGGLEKIREILEKTISERPENVLFGTDYSMCDTKKHIELIQSLNVSEDLKEAVFSKNAQKLYKL